MSRNGLWGIVGAFALTFGFSQAQAQVSVNAPSGLSQRSVTGKPAAPQPQKEAAKATHEAAQSHKEQAQPDRKPVQSRDDKADEATTRQRQSSAYTTTRASTATGYRIQAYTANNASAARSAATSRARSIAMRFPQYRTYITYKAPSWRLRIGDFTSLKAAQEALAKMKKVFPGYALTIVRDRINVWR